MTFTISKVLVLISLLLFVLATFGVSFPVVSIVLLASSFFVASFLGL